MGSRCSSVYKTLRACWHQRAVYYTIPGVFSSRLVGFQTHLFGIATSEAQSAICNLPHVFGIATCETQSAICNRLPSGRICNPRIRRTNMTMLITGGAGFIGCHPAATLLRPGERVPIVDNLL